ncbi:MAG: hypothetical protein OXE43_13850 [Chloroflexi bacterium]|nr:hypothetical protein [Chloroflexota bacterium]
MPGRENHVRALVEAIAHHQSAYGYPPTMRELMKLVGFSSTSVATYWLDVCESLGLIVRAPRLARAVKLTAAGRALAKLPPEREAPAAR